MGFGRRGIPTFQTGKPTSYEPANKPSEVRPLDHEVSKNDTKKGMSSAGNKRKRGFPLMAFRGGSNNAQTHQQNHQPLDKMDIELPAKRRRSGGLQDLRQWRSSELPSEMMEENRFTSAQRRQMSIRQKQAQLAQWSPGEPDLVLPNDYNDWSERTHETSNTWYANDVCESWFYLEKKYHWSPNFLKKSKTLKPHMIMILNAWMVEVILKFNLREETLWHTFHLMNRYLDKNPDVARDDFQMVGCACMWIAAKFNDVNPMCASDLVYVCKDAFDEEDLKRCEVEVCTALKWQIGGPTAYQFMCRFAGVAQSRLEINGNAKLANRVKWLAYYGMERAALDYQIFANTSSSNLAAAALLMAINCVGKKWTPELKRVTGVEAAEVKPLARCIRNLVTWFDSKGHKSVIKKYGVEERGRVSALRIKKGTGTRGKK